MVPLERIRYLFKEANLPELDAMYKSPEDALQLWTAGLTFAESLIGMYIKQHPLVDFRTGLQ